MKENKKKKLTIYSIYVDIIAGIYKGYKGEIFQRIGRGYLMDVIVGAVGRHAVIPIEDLIFIMPDNSKIKYEKFIGNDGEEHYRPVGIQRGTGENIILEEKIGSPIDDEPLFIPESGNFNIKSNSKDDYDTDFNDEDDDNIDINNNDKSLKQNINLEDLIPEEVNIDTHYNYLVNYAAKANILRNTDKITGSLHTLFSIIGFSFDNETINSHSKRLKTALIESGLPLDDYTINCFVTAYIFIHVNNLGIGYPINIPGCKQTSNDDTGFITCVVIQSKFIVPRDNNFNIRYFVEILCPLLKTHIVPVTINTNILERRFAMANINSIKQKTNTIIDKSPRYTRFPEIKYIHVDDEIKQYILEKIIVRVTSLDSIKDQSILSILDYFYNNFNECIKGDKYREIKKNITSDFSKIVYPYIKEYEERVKYKQEKIYESIHVNKKRKYQTKILPQVIKNTPDKDIKYYQELYSNRIISEIKYSIDKGKINKEESNILQQFLYFIRHYNNDNFELFIESSEYDNLYEKSDSIEWNTIMPYVFKYRNLIRTKEFDPITVPSIAEDISKNKTEIAYMKQGIKQDLVIELKNLMKESKMSMVNIKIIEFVINNIDYICDLNFNQIKEIKLNLITEINPVERQKLNMIMKVNTKFYKYLNKKRNEQISSNIRSIVRKRKI